MSPKDGLNSGINVLYLTLNIETFHKYDDDDDDGDQLFPCI